MKCLLCGKPCWQTYAGGTCLDCHMKVKEIAKAQKAAKANTPSKTQAKVLAAGAMKKGDVRKIPAAYGCEQWACQGSGKNPYIVTHKTSGASSQAYEWQCSCPAWAMNTPREDCKHILRVKLGEGLVTVNVAPTPSAGGVLVQKEGRKFR